MLQVDYGNRRVVYPYVASSDWEKVNKQREWCSATFKDETWHYYHPQLVFYFKRERDMMMFKLRWS